MTDSDSGTLSQEEIAFQFQLPERRAKVTQLIKGMAGETSAQRRDSGHSGSEEIYCICRSSDCSRFMIACDHCNVWYHGDCINVTQQESNFIKRFFCQLCRGKNSSLKIVYKKMIKDKDKEKDKDRVKDREKIKVTEKEEKQDKTWEKPHKSRDKSDKKHRKKHKEKKSSSHHRHSESHASTAEAAAAAAKHRKSSRRCMECEACHREEDCGCCDYCEDKEKFGGPNKLHQKCRKRQCLNWSFSKKTVPEMKETAAVTMDTSFEKVESDQKMDFTPTLDTSFSSPKKKKEKPRKDPELSSPGKSRAKPQKEKEKKKRPKRKPPSEKGSPRKPYTKRKRPDTVPEEIMTVDEERSPRQCHGPECIEPAREGSKYCSDECGMKLATNRIFEILPQRIQQWQSKSCQAEDKNKLRLETIRQQQLQARAKLMELDQRHRDLDALLLRAKQAMAELDSEMPDEEEEGATVYCVTCGHEVGQRTALKHMEKCFTRFESQTSFGSYYKSRIEENSMFCDYYSNQSKTYCKRLKVLCPEHSKEPKVSPDEVCGYPLPVKVFENSGKYCHTPKRKCNRHHCWDKLRRAAIDMERVRQWMRLDELFEEERNIRQAMANRAGVLGLMLHQTIDHDPLSTMPQGTVSPDEVCGYPLPVKVFENSGKYCHTPKRKCNRHHCWDKLRRAAIDMERVRQWMRLDELFEEERNIRQAMANRAGVLGLMLHQTIDHDPLSTMPQGTVKG